MRELGGTAEEEHRQVGQLARASASTWSWWSGRRPRLYDALAADEATATTRHVETVDEAAEWLRENVAGSDVVLVKASRSRQLETVADMLVGDPVVDEVEERKGAVG